MERDLYMGRIAFTSEPVSTPVSLGATDGFHPRWVLPGSALDGWLADQPSVGALRIIGIVIRVMGLPGVRPS